MQKPDLNLNTMKTRPEIFTLTGKSLAEDLEKSGAMLAQLAKSSDPVNIKAHTIKSILSVLILHFKREYTLITYKKKAKHALNDAGFFHLSDLARRLEKKQRALQRRAGRFNKAFVFNLDGRKFYYLYHVETFFK